MCCLFFKGKDAAERDVVLTKWEIDLKSMHPKCPITCDVKKPECKHSAEEIMNEFQKRASFVIKNVHHVNVIPYLNEHCEISHGRFNVMLVQECVESVSIEKLCDQGVVPSLPLMAESILNAISHLHSRDHKIKHGLINEKSIYLDKMGVYRATDFHLIPYLMYLGGVAQHPAPANDFKALGLLLEYANAKSQCLLRDFIQKCSLEIAQPCWDLLTHEYLTNAHSDNRIYGGPFIKHFDIGEELGKGSFGKVISAKHTTGRESYALKLVEIPKGSEKKYGKVKREVWLHNKF